MKNYGQIVWKYSPCFKRQFIFHFFSDYFCFKIISMSMDNIFLCHFPLLGNHTPVQIIIIATGGQMVLMVVIGFVYLFNSGG